MAFADWDAFLSALTSPRTRVFLTQTVTPFGTAGLGRMTSCWTPNGGVAPTTAVVPTKATVGAINTWENSGGSFENYCVGGYGQMSHQSGGVTPAMGMVYICDRLSHQAGLSGTAVGAQTTNLPTAALTRFTSGVGVMAAFEIYTTLGNNGGGTQSVSASYTNTTPTAGRTCPAQAWSQTGYREGQAFVPMPLQVGDIGVTSVESVTNSASTGTVGNFGITLYKPLLALPCYGHGEILWDPIISGMMGGGLPAIPDDACLFAVLVATANNAHRLSGILSFAEA